MPEHKYYEKNKEAYREYYRQYYREHKADKKKYNENYRKVLPQPKPKFNLETWNDKKAEQYLNRKDAL